MHALRFALGASILMGALAGLGNAQAALEWRALHPAVLPQSDDAAVLAAADDSGNVYVVFQMLYQPPGPRTALVKFTAHGQALWVRRFGSIVARDLAVAPGGDVYLCGTTAAGPAAMLVLRCDPDGNLRWRTSVAGAVARTLDFDGAGAVIVAGSAGGDILVQAFDDAGLTLWETRIDGPQHLDDGAACLAIDAAGDIFVAGSVGTPNGSSDAVVAKLAGDGRTQWSSTWSATTGRESFGSIASDGQGGVIVGGDVHFVFQGWPPVEYVNAQIARCDGAGRFLWHQPPYGIAINTAARSVLVDRDGQIWAAIQEDPYAFQKPSIVVQRIAGGSGAELSTFAYDGPAHTGAWPGGLALDDAGQVLVSGGAGQFFGSTTDQTVLMGMDAAGNPAWTQLFSAPGAGLIAAQCCMAPGDRAVLFGSAYFGIFLSRGLVLQVELASAAEDSSR